MKFQSLTPLRLGFIGGGCNSAVGYAHYCAAHLDGEWELVAGCFSRDDRVNAISARQYSVASDSVYRHWQQLLDQRDDQLDAIVVLTPTPTHERIVSYALQKGLAVICEKSLTQDVSSGQRIRSALSTSNGRLLVTYNYSAYPMIRELKARIQANELGRVHSVHVEMPQEGFARLVDGGQQPSPQQWRLKDGAIPTIHLDLTTHLHHLIYFLTGQTPRSVLADHNTFGWFEDVIDDATAIVKYRDAMTARYWVSKSALGYKNGLKIRVCGEKGAASWLQTNPEQLHWHSVNGNHEIIERGSPCLMANQLEFNRFKAGHPAGFIEAFANLYRDYALALRHPETSGAETVFAQYGIEPALEGLALMDAMARSHQNQQWETVHDHRSPNLSRSHTLVSRDSQLAHKRA